MNYMMTLKLLRISHLNAVQFKNFKREELFSTFNRHVDVFGNRYYEDLHNTVVYECPAAKNQILLPLFCLPILCLDSNDVVNFLFGDYGVESKHEKKYDSNSSNFQI